MVRREGGRTARQHDTPLPPEHLASRDDLEDISNLLVGIHINWRFLCCWLTISMRLTVRLFASVQPGRFLEAGNPTGLTGLLTHPAPRSTLLFLYTQTLEKLKALPEHSVYRQSTEALTKHRYGIVESFKAPGYEEWRKKAQETVQKYQGGGMENSESPVRGITNDGSFIVSSLGQDLDERMMEWDGEKVSDGTLEGTRTAKERANQRLLAQDAQEMNFKQLNWEPEPSLEATQVSEMENKIGAGLIEEVIQVAEGELKLVDVMTESKVWEELEEKASEGQWEYFSRDQHATGT